MTKKKLLAISSGGGHWLQLCRLLPAFKHLDVSLATVHKSYAQQVPNHRFYCIPDATRWNKVKLLRLAVSIAYVLLRERPDFVVSTGAAPGYIAVRLGKYLGSRTIWVDSIANAEELSLSGKRIEKYADLWLTQWPHLASETGPFYAGSVI